MKVITDTNKTLVLQRVCPFCHKENTLTINFTPLFTRTKFMEGLNAWRSGECIQNAIPNLTADQREFFITGICNKCW